VKNHEGKGVDNCFLSGKLNDLFALRRDKKAEGNVVF